MSFPVHPKSLYMELSEYWHLSHYIESSFSAKKPAFQRKGSDGPNTGPAEVFEASVEAVEASVEVVDRKQKRSIFNFSQLIRFTIYI